LFAISCIESGVDIPTVSRWPGHKDGGALATKVYGALCGFSNERGHRSSHVLDLSTLEIKIPDLLLKQVNENYP